MKIKTISISLLIATSSLLWTGCVKEGPRGPAGYDGLDGNANVISSIWYTPASWSGQTGDWYFQVNNTAITQDIVENGAILGYVSLPNDIYDNGVRPLPTYALGCDWDFVIPDNGSIVFNSNANLQPGTTGYSFRFILIPASVYLKSSKLKSKSITELKNMPYAEVCKLLGIKE